jgi:RecA-family ATPase
VNVPYARQEVLEKAIECCLSTIDGAAEGEEEVVFSKFSSLAIRHAYSAGWAKADIVDRLENAGAAIGLDADLRQRILSDGILRVEGAESAGEILASVEESESTGTKTPLPLPTITPLVWKGTEPVQQRWLASGRIPSGDLTLYSGNGGTGKTETAVQLLVSVAAGLGDWLGCVVESGPVLFLSCEEPEPNVRDRIERICKHRGIDPYVVENLHLHCPDLESTWLATVDGSGRVANTQLLQQLESWVAIHKPVLLVIDSIAAVFDGEAIARRQVRRFLAMLRRIARDYGIAIVLLDHPSVRGMADGSGTANSVDWRNSVRAMLHLSDPDKDDPDQRTLEVKKSNYGRAGEQVKLRWNGTTFTTGPICEPSPHKTNANREVDEAYLRCLDIKVAQGVSVSSKPSRSGAAPVFAGMSQANGIKARAFAKAQERLLSAGKIKIEPYGPKSHDKTRIVRTQSL